MNQPSKIITEEFAMHLDQLVAQGSAGFNVLDSYLVTVARGIDPSPPVSRTQPIPGTDGAAQDATAAEAAQTAINAEAAQAAQAVITAQAAADAAQAAVQAAAQAAAQSAQNATTAAPAAE